MAFCLTIANLAMTMASPARAQEVVQGADSESSSANLHLPVVSPDSSGRSSYIRRAATRPLEEVRNAGFQLLQDQQEIWTSPFHLRLPDAEWLVPAAGVSAAAFLTDPSFSRALPNDAGQLHTFNKVRTFSVGALGAASGGLYLWSLHTHDERQRETGLLATEAAIDSLMLTQSLQLIGGRERPLQGNGNGAFFSGGTSFPSNHSAVAWATAGILAHEYHGPLTKIFAYGLATTVSVMSVSSKEHFPSDVLIGSAMGWLVSEHVYRKRHNPELGGAAWNSIPEFIRGDASGPVRYPGSTYVPIGSWVYRAFDRLAALGLISTAYQGVRPWTRQQCARLLADVDYALAGSLSANPRLYAQAGNLLEALHREFAREETTFPGVNRSADVEAVYSRIVSASGAVLSDGYHFGQTFAYDYGRPFRQGTNLTDGGAVSATYGTLFFYVNGEFQHSPSSPPLSPAALQFIAERDKTDAPPATPFAPVNRFALLDAYVGMNLHGWQITFGNQSLDWGPGIGGSLLLSNNAAPFPMLRITNENPFEIPGLSKVLGPFSIVQFYGRLEGHAGVEQPWIYGQKISFKPFHSLEFAYSRTTLFGGMRGDPVTAGNFFDSLYGRVNPTVNSVPGDSRTAIDWTWRLPGLHDWVTFYGELEDDDDLIPLQNVSKSVWRPGIYLPHLPWLLNWDFHFEYTASTSPGRAAFQNHGSLNYWNFDYPDGYTNNGNLLGNSVGREGVTMQAWLRYWAAPRRTFDFSWKQSIVLRDYVPGGGKWQDYEASYSVTRRSGVYFKGLVQFEHIFAYPLLFPGAKNNVTAALEIGFLPPWGRKDNSLSSSRSTDAVLSNGSTLR